MNASDFVRWENDVFKLTQLLSVEIPFLKIPYNLFVVKERNQLHRNVTVKVFGEFIYICCFQNSSEEKQVHSCYRSHINDL